MGKVKKNSKKVETFCSPRLRALRILDEVLALPKNQKKLKKAFQEAIDEDAVLFYRQVIKPTAEKELFLEGVGNEKVAGVKFLFTSDKEEIDVS